MSEDQARSFSTVPAPAGTRLLGGYLLPGRVSDPRPAITQARAAESAGMGSVWLAERWGSKDVAAIAGAVGQATSTVRIALGATHFQTRHPSVFSSMVMTLQALTNGRLIVGIGRNTSLTWPAMGLPPASNAVLVDRLSIHRRLVKGEGVTYDGPAGKFPRLRLIDLPDVPPPPVIFTAIGPKSLELAGRHFDGVMLHPFLSVDATARSAAAVRAAADAAGRDPKAVRIYATVVVAADLSPSEEAAVVAGRAVTYLQIPGIGDSMVQANGWDEAPLKALREHPMFAGVRKLADQAFTREQLVEVARVLPPEWLSTTSAVGTAAQCARRLQDFIAAGADELILHGSTPDQLGPTVAAFAQV